MSRMESAMARMQSRLQGRIGITVTLIRDDSETSDVPATVGNQILKVNEDGEVRTVRTDKDFFIHRDDYLVDGTPVEPRVSDLIVATFQGAEQTFELRPYGDEIVYRWSDEYEQTYRIHTKRIS